MPRDTRCFEVLIASPGDVSDERQIMLECIEDWNSANSKNDAVVLLPRRWELDAYPEIGERPQETINKQIVESADLLMGAFWHRLGTPTGVAESGTAEEIGRFLASKKPVSLYFSQAPVPYDHNPEQFAAVKQYKADVREQGIVFDYKDKHDLRRMVSRHLTQKMNVLLSATAAEAATAKKGLAKISVETPRTGRSGDVRTVTIQIVVENLSETETIAQYICVVTVPRACLTHQSAYIGGEIPSGSLDKRRFRIPNDMSGPLQPIYPESKRSFFALELGIDQLLMSGTHLAGDVDMVLSDEVSAKVVIGEERYEVKKRIADILPDPRRA